MVIPAVRLRRYILNTVVETCKLQKVAPVAFLTRAYKSDGLDVPDLTASRRLIKPLQG